MNYFAFTKIKFYKSKVAVPHIKLNKAELGFCLLQISDRIRGSGDSDADHAKSMEYSLLMTTFISVLGGFCFIMCSLYLVKDREAAEEYTRVHDDDSSLLASVATDNYATTGDENQALISDDDDDDDDDKLLGTEPVTPISSEREALVVPVDVHSAPPGQEEHNNHVA